LDCSMRPSRKMRSRCDVMLVAPMWRPSSHAPAAPIQRIHATRRITMDLRGHARESVLAISCSILKQSRCTSNLTDCSVVGAGSRIHVIDSDRERDARADAAREARLRARDPRWAPLSLSFCAGCAFRRDLLKKLVLTTVHRTCITERGVRTAELFERPGASDFGSASGRRVRGGGQCKRRARCPRLGTGYDHTLIAQVAESKEHARKIQVLGCLHSLLISIRRTYSVRTVHGRQLVSPKETIRIAISLPLMIHSLPSMS
jgi:hypothetical protein